MKPKLYIWMPDITFTPIWTPEVLWEQRHHVFLSRFLFAPEKVFFCLENFKVSSLTIGN